MTGVSLELTDKEAAHFRDYQEYREAFETLVDAGVFATKNGKAVLHFDSSGTLQQITFDVVGWKKSTRTQVA